MVARTSGATMAHPEENLDPVTAFGTEHHHHPRLRRKARPGMRHSGQPVVPFAEVCRLGRNHDPDGLFWKDHSAFLSATTSAAARFGLHSGATCKTAPLERDGFRMNRGIPTRFDF